MILLYFGPEVIAPVASALAAITGVIVMFWHRTVEITRTVTRRFLALFRFGKGSNRHRP